ncbi:MAG: phenylalanine--tRNA ligase subunit beta [Candidatus Omnitrophica bacterium]|nr:phenylalanine--tRNA ligase subunit beta [Candidatus Omnitrophota bacterium]
MKVTYNWLRDFVEIKISPQALAEKLTMAGLEVTSLEEREGDFIFEIEITSNRPDWLSIIGIAREVAAITGKSLKVPQVKNLKKEDAGFKIEIADKKDCPLYTAKIIKGVKVGPSPEWLKKRLELIGCRSVNNIVDITNYVLFEWGEPLHAFDLARLTDSSILVRRGKPNEKIITIDGAEKVLNTDVLVIADKDRPMAVAGVMGGKSSEVVLATRDILLEAAVFNPIVVRRGRRQLGLDSDSAYRFERGVDGTIVETASSYAAALIQKLAGGTLVLATSSKAAKPKIKKIALNVSTVQKTLGVNIAAAKIKKILQGLGFRAKSKTKNSLIVEVPFFRQDVNLEIDLIEEVARIYGYELIPQTLPAIKPKGTVLQTRDTVSSIKNILVGLGLNEVITYSLMDRDMLKNCAGRESNEAIEILNPLSKEQGILRPSLVSGLSNCVAYNLNQQQDYVNIFEIAKVFYNVSGDPKEELVLGIALCGIKSGFVSGQGLIKEEAGFLHLKGIVESLFSRLGVKDYAFNTQDNSSCLALSVQGEKIGIINRLGKEFLDELGIKNKDVFILEISLDKVFSRLQLKKHFLELPKYPGIVRDISFILKEDVLVSQILKAAQEKGGSLLRQVKVVDSYKGKQIPPGYKGLTISCLYRCQERTLTEAEVSPVHNLICGVLTERFGAKMR